MPSLHWPAGLSNRPMTAAYRRVKPGENQRRRRRSKSRYQIRFRTLPYDRSAPKTNPIQKIQPTIQCNKSVDLCRTRPTRWVAKWERLTGSASSRSSIRLSNFRQGHDESMAADFEGQEFLLYGELGDGPGDTPPRYRNFAYSALASFKMGISGSASFQSARKSL
jgi:hypothetical protein